MARIPVADLIALFVRMYNEHWAYKANAAEEGCVDCSGAFKWAYKQFGAQIAHGSNSIAHKYIVELLPISEAKPGMAAFKCRPWTADQSGNSWYNQPPGDLHHIGLVDNDPRYVLNAKGEKYGFCRNELTEKNGWSYVAYLTAVDYDGGGGDMKKGTVVLPSGTSGSTVNLRTSPSKAGKIITRVPVGSIVYILADKGEWMMLDYNGQIGYMMSNFIEYSGQDDTGTEPDPEDGVVISSEDAERIRNAVKIILDIIGG